MSDHEDSNNKVGRKVDNIIMGVILGGAIGSVLGLTLAPRKGSETRKLLKQKGSDIIDKSKEISEQFMRNHKESFQSAKYQLHKGRKGGFFRWLFGGEKKNKSEEITHVIDDEK